jgi:membrane-associated phospholipid phosphatase
MQETHAETNAETIDPPKAQRKPLHKVVPKLLLTSAVFWLPMLLFVGLANAVRSNHALPGDDAILNGIHHFSSPALDKLAVAVTTLGNPAVVVIGVAVAAAVLAYKRYRRQAVFLLFSAAGTAAINVIIKFLFHRDRPSLWARIVTENSYSFPSGHAMISSALAFSVIILCWHTRYRWLVVIVSTLFFLLVSLSRLYLGVHFPSDVVGGWSVSLLWIATLHYAFGRFGRRDKGRSQASDRSN